MEARALPTVPAPWRTPVPTGSPVRVTVTHVTDPACPWAYSYEPALRVLEARYGDQLEFRTVMIGLVADVEQAVARGFTPEVRALSSLAFRRFGMPITPDVPKRLTASAPACRLVKAAALQGEHFGEAILRVLRFAYFTSDLLLDSDEALTEVCRAVPGLDGEQAMDDLRSEPVAESYERDRAEARSPLALARKLGRTANSDGLDRYTAPTLVFTAANGDCAVVPGFQPFEAAEVALLNLEPELVRLAVPEPVELLDAYPGGLTSQEFARVMADTTAPVDRPAGEATLIRLVGEGRAQRRRLADDALWVSATHA